MNTTRTMTLAVLIVTSGLALQIAQAQQPGIRRIDLQRHDLSVPGREVSQARVEIDPGMTAPRHSHPGEEIIYVLEGITVPQDIHHENEQAVDNHRAGHRMSRIGKVVYTARTETTGGREKGASRSS